MTEQAKKTADSAVALGWLPEEFRSWAESSALMQPALETILEDRDTRLYGSTGASRLMTALTGVIRKQLNRRESDRAVAVILAATREAEESAFRLAGKLAAATALTVTGTAGIRDRAGLTTALKAPADLLVTNPKTLEKLFDASLVSPEALKTLIIDEVEWHEALGHTALITKLCAKLPAARQLIAIATNSRETDTNGLLGLLHAPVFCRAPDRAVTTAAAERAVFVPEDRLTEYLLLEAARTPVLFLNGSPSESMRLLAAMKDAGLDPKRATTAQSASTLENTVLKFAAGRLPQLVMPHVLLKEFSAGEVRRLVHTELPGGPLVYLEHLALIPEGGELVTVVTPETLALAEKLFCAVEKKLTLENPFAVPDIRPEIGLQLRREKLTVRRYEEVPQEEPAAEMPASDDDDDKPSRTPRKFDRNKKKSFKKDFRKERGKPFRKKERQTSLSEAERKEAARRLNELTNAPFSDPSTGELRQVTQDLPKKKRPSRRKDIRNTDNKPAVTESLQAPATDVQAVAASADQNTVPVAETQSQPRPNNIPRKRFSKFKKPRRDFREEKAAPAEGKPAEQTDKPAKADKPTGTQKPRRERPAAKEQARPERKQRPPRSNRKAEAPAQKPRWEEDDDNFGNSIHYQPKRQNLRTLRSDQPIHWEPTDPFHPSSQALSLPQLMPDEFAGRRDDRRGQERRFKNNKTGFRRKRGQRGE